MHNIYIYLYIHFVIELSIQQKSRIAFFQLQVSSQPLLMRSYVHWTNFSAQLVLNHLKKNKQIHFRAKIKSDGEKGLK